MNPWRKRRRRRLYRARQYLAREFQRAFLEAISKSGPLFYDEATVERMRETIVEALTDFLPPRYARAAVYGPEPRLIEFTIHVSGMT
jgi:hypothetical protein